MLGTALLSCWRGIVSLTGPKSESRNAQQYSLALDTGKTGTLTRAQLESGFNSWFTAWNTNHSGTLTKSQFRPGSAKCYRRRPTVKPGQSGTFNLRGTRRPSRTASGRDAMMAALPSTPGAKPAHPRKVR